MFFMTDKEHTADEKIFGKGNLVYCSQHLAVHVTGWCTVPNSEKVGLGLKSDLQGYDKANDKCRHLGLEIYKASVDNISC